jgi:hypothetical protein
MMDALLNEALAARVLSLQPRTLTRWRWAGKGPSYCKIGGAIRYHAHDLEAFAARGRVAAND